MPNLLLPLPETYMSIERPATLDIIRQVKTLTQMHDHDLVISYRGVSEVSKLINGSLTTAEDVADSAFFRQAGKLSAVVNEQYDETSYLTLPIRYQDALLIFQDNALDVRLKPVMSPTEVTISFTYRAQDKKSAAAWRDNIRNRIKQNNEVMTHEIAYEFGIPSQYILILGEIHRLRENVAGYGEEFGKWFVEHASEKLTTLTKMDGTKPHIVFKERQLQVQGWFDFTEPPVPDKGDVGSLWTVGFEYRFRYDKPTHMVMEYPLTVHNQLLSKVFRGEGVDTTYHRMIGDMSLSNQRYDYFRKQDNHYYEQFEGIRIPHFDEWYPKKVPLTESTLLLALFRVDPDDPTLVLDLNELGGYVIKDEFKAFMTKYREYLPLGQANPFHISVYEYDVWMDDSLITVDENLVVRSTVPLDLRKVYRLHIGLISDLSILTQEAEDRLRNEPAACLEILKALGPHLEGCGLLPVPIGNKLISKKQYRTALEHIQSTHPIFKGESRGYANVAQFIVRTSKES